jgi:hypothetical protein
MKEKHLLIIVYNVETSLAFLLIFFELVFA